MPDTRSKQPFEVNRSLSLGKLFGLVEASLDTALTKQTGWAWKDVDVAIQIHDIVLSLRHMRYGIFSQNLKTVEASTGKILDDKTDEKITFASLLDEVETHNSFLARTMRSYLDDAVDNVEDIRSCVDAPKDTILPSVKLRNVKKLRISVHCFALQREPLQAYIERTSASTSTQTFKLETTLRSASGQTDTSTPEVKPPQYVEGPIPDGTRMIRIGSLAQTGTLRTDTNMSSMSRGKGPRLEELINDSLTRSAFSKSDFLPQSQLDNLLNEFNIRRELRKSGCETDPELVSFIHNHAKKTFAILAYLDLVKYAAGLKELNFTDDYLPIEVKRRRVTSLSGFLKDAGALDWFLTWRLEITKTSSRSSKDPDESSSDEDDTGSNQVDWKGIRLFCRAQWIFLAKVFTKGSIFETVYDNCPLPIIKYKQDVASGGFSALHQGRLHSAHQVGLITGDLIAIKELKDDKSRSEKAYNVEIDALEMVQKLNHERIVKFVAGFEQYGQRYLMFQWVDGGNLREFWEREPSNLNREMIEWVLKEIKGLAEALNSWHNYDPDPYSQRFCRHGDLKPENIVLEKGIGGRGKFLIADMGLAKIHTQPTHVRRTQSSGLLGTLRYQAPELHRLKPQISRSIDIWSFGCITLEFIIWMLYGYEDLHAFNTALYELSNKFYVYDDQEVRLHPKAQQWVDHMMNTSLSKPGPSLSDALSDLLRLVISRLLIADPESNGDLSRTLTKQSLSNEVPIAIEIPIIMTTNEDGETPVIHGMSRAKIGEVCEALSTIVANTSSEYIYNPHFSRTPENSSGPQKSTQLYTNLEERFDSGFHSRSTTFPNTAHPYLTPNLSDVWEIYSDNPFAKNVFRMLGGDDIKETLPTKAASIVSLCENCSNNGGGILLDRGYSSRMKDIKENSHVCGLCRVLFDNSESNTELTYYRNGSSLATSKNGPPVWSIVVGSGATNAPLDIQRGFPLLPVPGGSVQAELIREWVHDCDSKHSCGSRESIVMPTRLIDLQLKSNRNNLNLDCSKFRSDRRYVALSHRWGDPKKHKSISLLTDNLEQWERHLNLSKLPKTFQDAVTITRQLGIRYLWIDSLCIIQDSEEDWREECQKMENVFSFAHVTLSATSSSGVQDGFIEPDTVKNFRGRIAYPFDFVADNRESTRFYLCNAIDNFKRDVEDAELGTRGWVFQERALSRRTIHFTQTQLYWECGEGIRSETLNKLSNAKSAFISDPEFPKSMASQYKGLRIEFFKEIYGRYSEKIFTYETDRSLGMAGIERRLEKVFNATAWCGILDDPKDPSFLRRSLLWRTSPKIATFNSPSNLNNIEYPADRPVPTWSWMAVKRPIEYMAAPFGEMNWNLDLMLEYQSLKIRGRTNQNQPTGILRGVKLQLTDYSTDDYYRDDRRHWDESKPECIIVGTEKTNDSTTPQKHYVILIAPSETGDHYERVGVARINRAVSWKPTGSPVRVK